ncbi:MAG: hypothetical protein A3C56_13220 [Ignavibacteria bacterium RIFCSPHIGHO2_02_FULL_56_12]|nr:MAG: hypothetical protein A3C56_13220 [Ignavibacteria bacterium RIFCSPHIGHO2_02_FULL_56_12]
MPSLIFVLILRRSLLLLAASLLFPPFLVSQTVTVTGSVRDAVSRDPLPAATVRVVGTDRGTIANADGSYRLVLPAGAYRCAFSFIGYVSDTVTVGSNMNTHVDVNLQPSPIQFPEVVVTGEDPAMAIMRQVIERKKKWQNALETYRFEAFTRQTIRRDTAIASIAETFTTGYWRRGDTLREVIRQKRQTQNVPEARNLAAVGGIVNFYDDDIRFAGYTFVGFTAPSAFDMYNFKLVGTQSTDGRTVFRISIHPTTRLAPLFYGTINVVDEQFALAGVHVRPNEAFVIPLVPDFSLAYDQQFALVSGRYWMPVDIRIKAIVRISFAGFTFPPFGLENVSSIYDYAINVALPDSLFQQRRIRSDSASAKYDSSFWAEREVIPLTREEHEAYVKLDSTQTLDKQFKPSGPLAGLDGPGFSWLKYADIHFNRVEGWYVGGENTFDSLAGRWTVRTAAGYGVADHRWKGSAGVECLWDSDHSLTTGAEWFSQARAISDEGYHSSFSNTLTSLLGKNDYFDYYRVQGGRVTIGARPLGEVSVRASFGREVHRSARQTTNYSLFYAREKYRPQPLVEEGVMQPIGLSVRWGPEAVMFNLIPQNELQIDMEHSARRSTGGEFDFSRVLVRGQVRIATFLRRNLFPAQLTMRLSAGTSTGSLPLQRQFALETQSSDYAPLGVLRAARVKEFAGDRFVQFSAEHNFRSAFFLWIGLPYFYERGIETVAYATVAASSFRSRRMSIAPAVSGVYSEAGIGINRLFQLFRLDVTYRFRAPEGIRVTLGVAQLL